MTKHIPSNPGLPCRPDPRPALALIEAIGRSPAADWAAEIRERQRDLELAALRRRLLPVLTVVVTDDAGLCDACGGLKGGYPRCADSGLPRWRGCGACHGTGRRTCR